MNTTQVSKSLGESETYLETSLETEADLLISPEVVPQEEGKPGFLFSDDDLEGIEDELEREEVAIGGDRKPGLALFTRIEHGGRKKWRYL